MQEPWSPGLNQECQLLLFSRSTGPNIDFPGAPGLHQECPLLLIPQSTGPNNDFRYHWALSYKK